MPRSLDEFYGSPTGGNKVSELMLGLTDEALVDVSEYIDQDALLKEQYEIRESYLREYHDIEQFIVKNIQINTDIRDEMVKTGFNTLDSAELEDYRMFPKGFMAVRGVFYCPSVSEMIPYYDDFRHTDIYQISNDTYEERYMLPICLPDGRVFTHMGYRPPVVDASSYKYIMGNVPWIDQGNLLGHLESLKLYPNKKIVYVCEGMMDAYRLSDLFKSPSIAILGARLTATKKAILTMLQNQGYMFIYVPDMDGAGLNKNLVDDPIFSNIMYIPKTAKDIDMLVKMKYIDYIRENYYSLKTDLEVEKVPASLIPTDALLILNEEIKQSIKYKYEFNSYPKSSASLFNAILRTFTHK